MFCSLPTPRPSSAWLSATRRSWSAKRSSTLRSHFCSTCFHWPWWQCSTGSSSAIFVRASSSNRSWLPAHQVCRAYRLTNLLHEPSINNYFQFPDKQHLLCPNSMHMMSINFELFAIKWCFLDNLAKKYFKKKQRVNHRGKHIWKQFQLLTSASGSSRWSILQMRCLSFTSVTVAAEPHAKDSSRERFHNFEGFLHFIFSFLASWWNSQFALKMDREIDR